MNFYPNVGGLHYSFIETSLDFGKPDLNHFLSFRNSLFLSKYLTKTINYEKNEKKKLLCVFIVAGLYCK